MIETAPPDFLTQGFCGMLPVEVRTRLLDVLRQPPRVWMQHDLADAIGIPAPSAFELLWQLSSEGWGLVELLTYHMACGEEPVASQRPGFLEQCPRCQSPMKMQDHSYRYQVHMVRQLVDAPSPPPAG